MKILLTGASGFIGEYLLKAIIHKFGASAVMALTSKPMANVNCLIYASISNFSLEKNAFNDITHVIHAGAATPKDNNQTDNIDLAFGNIQYTKELLANSFPNLVRIINISTLDVYAATEFALSESAEIDPISLYGSSKLYCEKMVKAFCAQSTVSYLNLRIGHVYGSGEEKYKKVIPIAMQNIIENQPLEIWGEGKDLRSFIFIEDVIEAIMNSVESAVGNIDINVVSGHAITIHELLDKIISVSGKAIPVNKIESNHKKRDLVFDNSLLLKVLLEKETDLIDGLTKEYDYMKAKYENSL